MLYAIWYRGEGGELRVGIRRAMRLSGTSPSSVLPSESMHMGVIATATHAMLTRTMFSVYFKPRWVSGYLFLFYLYIDVKVPCLKKSVILLEKVFFFSCCRGMTHGFFHNWKSKIFSIEIFTH